MYMFMNRIYLIRGVYYYIELCVNSFVFIKTIAVKANDPPIH